MKVDIPTLQMLRGELTKVRCWITGFKEAGKNGPPGEDAIRQTIMLIDDLLAQGKKKS